MEIGNACWNAAFHLYFKNTRLGNHTRLIHNTTCTISLTQPSRKFEVLEVISERHILFSNGKRGVRGTDAYPEFACLMTTLSSNDCPLPRFITFPPWVFRF